MKRIKLLSIRANNFKCFTEKVQAFDDGMNIIEGANGTGKTTLMNAYLWVLFGKDSFGKEQDKVRPHDVNGKDIDNVEIECECTFDIDGSQIALKKVQKQKWVKDRATGETILKGNENSFCINGIPKSQTEYKKFIEEMFLEEKTFLQCTNALNIMNLDQKKKRETLMNLSGGVDTEEILASDSRFEELRTDLKIGKVDELITRSNQNIKELTKKKAEIPARIDQEQKSKIDLDFAELELQKKAILDEIKSLDDKETNIENQYAEFSKIRQDIVDLKYQLSDLERNANMDLQTKKRELEEEKGNASLNLGKLQRDLASKQSLVDYAKKQIDDGVKRIDELKEQWKCVSELKFDDSSLVCSFCGQEYPQEKKDDLKADFEQKKAKQLNEIIASGDSTKTFIIEEQQSLEKFQAEISQLTKDILKEQERLEKAKSQLSELPNEIDVSGTDEYKEIQLKISANEELLEKASSIDDLRALYRGEKTIKQSELTEVEIKLSKANDNAEKDERIAILQKQQIEISQQIANEQRYLDLLNDFNAKRMQMLEESINKHFKTVKWKMFEQLGNGNLADVCYATVNGSIYGQGLNDSDCILANLEIIQTFQQLNGIELPCWIDRAESVESKRFNDYKGQLILLKVKEV